MAITRITETRLSSLRERRSSVKKITIPACHVPRPGTSRFPLSEYVYNKR